MKCCRPKKSSSRTQRFVTLLTRLGPDGDVNKANIRVVTVSKSERTVGINALRDIARATIHKYMPLAKVAVTDPPFIEGAAGEAPLMVQVRASTYEELAPLARQYEQAMKGVPGVTDVNMKYTPGQPELRISVDRDRAARAGVPVANLAMLMRAGIEGDEAGKMRQGKDEVPIRVRLEARRPRDGGRRSQNDRMDSQGSDDPRRPRDGRPR